MGVMRAYRRFHRLLGLLTSVMLALAIGPRSGLACPTNTHAHHRCDEPGRQTPPTTPPCCDLAAPCGTATAIRETVPATVALNRDVVIGARDEVVPAGLIFSPEPPPPKR